MKDLKDMLAESLEINEAQEINGETKVTTMTWDKLSGYLKDNIEDYEEFAANRNIKIDGVGLTYKKAPKPQITFKEKPTFDEVTDQLIDLINSFEKAGSRPAKYKKSREHNPRGIDKEKMDARIKRNQNDPEMQKYAR